MTKKINTRGLYCFNTKTNRCYQVRSNTVGTRNRVTATDIYGNTHRLAVTHCIPMTPFEAAVVGEGERFTRRKHTTNDAQKQLIYCYREFISSHK